MARSVMYVVCDDFVVSQKARTWGQENNVDVRIYSHSQWNNTYRDLTTASGLRTDGVVLSGGHANNTGGGKVLSFPNPQPGKKVASMNDIESQAIQNAIAEYKGNLTEAAKALGIGRATLYRKVKQYNIDPSQARNKAPKAA
jgi:transcriptional regulator of acetoin/glycerol metabolism